MARGKPRLDHSVHPLRVLLELDSPRIRLKRTCTNPRCINEDHHRITLAQDHKYGDLPPPTWRHPVKGLSVHDYEEIKDLLRSNITPEELLQYPTRIQNEISLRRKTTP